MAPTTTTATAAPDTASYNNMLPVFGGGLTTTWITVERLGKPPPGPNGPATVTVTLYVLGGVISSTVMLSVDVAVPLAGRSTVDGFIDAIRPIIRGVGEAENDTFPANPTWLVIVTVEDPWLAGTRVREDGLGLVVKSGTA